LKKHYKELKDDKLHTDTHNEQRIEQYNTEIRDNKNENEKLAAQIKEVEDDIDILITHYSNACTYIS
jgi:septal ring factor EnvC (AmiA/AmiB activator)